MVWVIIFTIVSVILANAPLLYIIFRVHYPSGLSVLWGYAPNQFFFPLIAFPMAAFATFIAMKLILSTLQAQELTSHHPVIRWSVDNWIVICLIGIILTSTICIIDYFSSAKTFDKLKPVYAQKAVIAAKEVRQTILAMPMDNRSESRRELIRDWRNEKKTVLVDLKNSNDLERDILALPAGIYLQIIQDPILQRNLHLMNTTVHALNVVQLFVSFLTSYCALFATILCVYLFKTNEFSIKIPEAQKALSAVFFAITFFSLFPVFYAQQREEIEYLVGTGYTIMPHVFTGLIAITVLTTLASLGYVENNWFNLIAARIIPILFIAIGFGVNFLPYHPLKQITGVEANWGTRVLLVICFLISWVLIGLHLWPWNHENNNSATAKEPVRKQNYDVKE